MHWKELIVGKPITYNWYIPQRTITEGIIVDATLGRTTAMNLKILNSAGELTQLWHFEVLQPVHELLYGSDNKRIFNRSNDYKHKFPLITPVIGDYLNPLAPCKRFPTTKVTEVNGNTLKFEGDFRWFSLKELNIPRIPYPERLEV